MTEDGPTREPRQPQRDDQPTPELTRRSLLTHCALAAGAASGAGIASPASGRAPSEESSEKDRTQQQVSTVPRGSVGDEDGSRLREGTERISPEGGGTERKGTGIEEAETKRSGRYSGTVDRIVDGEHVVILLESGGRTVAQVVLSSSRLPRASEGARASVWLFRGRVLYARVH